MSVGLRSLAAAVGAVILLSAQALAQEAPGAPRAGRPAAGSKPAPAPGELRLTRKDAVLRAIANNPSLEVSRIDAQIAGEGVEQAESEFEPVGFLGTTYGKFRDPSFSRAIPGTNPPVTFSGLPPGLVVNPSSAFSWTGGARVRAPLGTQIQGSYALRRVKTQNAFALNPSYTPAFELTVSQPLLRGAGFGYNEAFIDIATLGHEAQKANLEAALLDMALQVETAYWLYAASLEAVKVADKALETARDALRRARSRKEAGNATAIDVYAAETGYAQREEQKIAAENDSLRAQDQLLQLITKPGDRAGWRASIVLLDAPRLDDAPVDVDRTIGEAMNRRPEVRALGHQASAESRSIDRAEWDLLPRVDLSGSWTQEGLGDGHHDSHAALFDMRYYSFTLGLNIEYPFLSRGTRSALREAELRRKRVLRQRDALEQAIVFDVRTAARDILSAKERIRASRVAVELAVKQLEAEQFRLAQGVVTSFEVLEKEEALTNARTTAIRAQLDYMTARARLARARGTSLSQHDIAVK